MKLAIVGLLATAVMGWALVRTGQIAIEVQRSGGGKQSAQVRPVTLLEETAEYRIIKHPLGETRAPCRPQRIASLTGAANDGLVALGIKPVLAVGSMWTRKGTKSYLDDQLADVPRLSSSGGVNLEAIYAAQPDLIIAGARELRAYDQLSLIAPTICLPTDASGNRELSLLDVGVAVDREQEAHQRLEKHRATVAAARDVLAKSAPGEKVTFLRFRRGTCVIYTRAAMFGPLLFEQLALTPDPNTPDVMHSGGWDVLSVERLSTLQADHVFAIIDPDSEYYLAKLAQTAIWRDIPAVRTQQLHRVDADVWLGDGVLGIEAIVDDVLAAMAPRRSGDGEQ